MSRAPPINSYFTHKSFNVLSTASTDFSYTIVRDNFRMLKVHPVQILLRFNIPGIVIGLYSTLVVGSNGHFVVLP